MDVEVDSKLVSAKGLNVPTRKPQPAFPSAGGYY